MLVLSFNDLASTELLSDAIALTESSEVLHGEQKIAVTVRIVRVINTYLDKRFCTDTFRGSKPRK